MADFHTFYGNWVSGFYRTRIEAEWTNVTESGFTLTVRTYVEIAEYYHDDGSNFSGRANPGNGYGNWVAGAAGYIYGPTSLLLTSKSTYITRTHAQQYISVYGETTNTFNPAYAGPSNASGSVGCSPKSSYAVTFNANGGTGAPAAQTKWYGETLTISATKPTRSGYIFKGWATSASATTATYQPGASYTTNAPLSLYAVWQQGTYTIAYAANGGSSTPASQTKTHGVALTLRPAISRANGTATYTVSYSVGYSGGTNPSSGTATKTTKYTFAGWKATNGTVYAGGASYTTDAATTMTAQWTSSSSTTSVTLPTPTRTGYTFQGWWTASTGGTKVGNGGATYTPTASITLHAHWSIIVYTVSYSANGGSGAPASQSKNHGTSITLSSTRPTRSGYTFLGWSTNAAGTGTAYAPGGSYTANAASTLYAVWVAVQVTSLSAYRSDSAGTRSDSGTYGHLSAGWKALGTIAGTVAVTATANDASVTSSLSNRSGSKTATADLSNTSVGTFGGSYAEDVAVRVSVTATLTVSYGGSSRSVSATRVATIPKVFRLLDALHGGTGLAIGAIATLANTFEVTLQTVFQNVVEVVQSNITRDGTYTEPANGDHQIRFVDSSRRILSYIGAHKTSNSPNNYLRLTAYGPSGSKTANLYLNASDTAGHLSTDCLWNSLKTDTGAFIVMDTRFDRDGSNPSENVWSAVFGFQDKDGEQLGYLQAYQLTNGATGLNLYAIAENSSGDTYSNYIRLSVDKSGYKAYAVGDAAAFRSAIGAVSTTTYETVTSDSTGTGVVTAKSNFSVYTAGNLNRAYKRNGVATVYLGFTTTNALNAGGSYNIATLNSGWRPNAMAGLWASGTRYGINASTQANGEIYITPTVAIPAGTTFYLGGTFVQA